MNDTSTRQQLQRAILRITKRASNTDGQADVDNIAIRLSSRYPQSGMTIDEICVEITSQLEKVRNQNDRRG